MAMKPRGYYTGPRKEGLIVEDNREIWEVYWAYYWYSKVPRKGSDDYKMYMEAKRRQQDDKFSSNKWPTTWIFD